MRKGKLLGFAKVELPISLRISDTPFHVGKNGAVAALSARPVLDQQGRQKREINGKQQDTPFLSGAIGAFPAVSPTLWLRLSSRRTPTRSMGTGDNLSGTVSS
jgi:hypothetical protein